MFKSPYSTFYMKIFHIMQPQYWNFHLKIFSVCGLIRLSHLMGNLFSDSALPITASWSHTACGRNSSVCAANSGGRSFSGFYVWPRATAGRLLSFLRLVVAAQQFRDNQHLFSCKTLVARTRQRRQQPREARRQKVASFISVALRWSHKPPEKVTISVKSSKRILMGNG